MQRHWTPETCKFKPPSLFFCFCCTAVLCTAVQIVHPWWAGVLLVGGWCYCCTAVLLLHCPAVTLARRRPLAQSIAPSIAAPSITRRHRRQGVHRWAAVVDRPPSPDRSLARSPARPPSLARRRRRRSGGLWPPSSLARRRPLARSPAVVRSFARRGSPAVARPPPLLLLVVLCYYCSSCATYYALRARFPNRAALRLLAIHSSVLLL